MGKSSPNMDFLVRLKNIIDDDSLAITYQTLGQYRTMLSQLIKKEIDEYLPCKMKECLTPYTKASIGCDICTYNQSNVKKR